MVVGKNSRQMGRNSRGRVATIILSFLFMIGAVLPMAHPYGNNVYAAAQVTTWDGLRSAVEHGDYDNNGIEIAGDFPYDGKSIEIPEGADIILTGSGTIYSSQRATYDSMFKVKSGGKLTIESGVTLSGKMMGDQGQTCPDGKDGRPTYTKDNFTGDLNNPDNPTDYVPKGFFIQVESGGKATLKGTVSDFITSRDKDKTPRYVAPIVANGDKAVFDLDGGTIKNNLVGYIVDDSQANKDAQSIKQYVKGAGPNVPRVPKASVQKENKDSFDRPRNKDAGIDGGLPGTGITATAGAVIYKGGAQGTITSGTITNNRGDTGGIMVSGEGTTVKTTVNMKGGVISKNVGVQFGGGSTAEQGGLIEMTGGNMEYNVAWFGGGAVYATENGVAWLLGLMNGKDGLHPQFDDRLDGKFLMNGGSLNNNTALTRGGAILADSDAVDVKKGALKDNMSRMLGGAVYVMGDHPKYTYTMYLTGLYVHDNVAVSGIKEARDSAARGPSSMYTETELDNFNSSLQRTLLPPTACGDVPDDVWGEVFSTNSDDMNDGWGTHGTGGGVWLCAYGTTYFNAGATSQVVIAKNYATGAAPLTNPVYPRWVRISSDGEIIREDIAYNTASSVATGTGRTGGNDLHADTGSSGSVIIKNESQYPGWIDENASTSSQVPYDLPVSEGRVNIVNNGTAQKMPDANVQVEVSGNISRRGGGLAANGTFMLGVRDDQANVESAVDLKKTWHATAERKPVSIRVSAVQGTNTAVIADVPLDGEANAPISEYDAVEELAPKGSTWNGRFKLPIELNGTEGKIKVFTPVLKEKYREAGDTDGIIDPTTLQGRAKLATAIKSIKEKNKDPLSGEIDEEAAIAEINKAISIKFSDNLKLSCKEYEMVYDDVSEKWTIKTEGGQPVESSSYVFTSKDVDLSEASFDLQSTSFYGEEYNQQTGQMEPVEIYQVHVFGIELALSAQNDNNPITEKYVNKEVHSDIVNFDQDFEYDIMAYVPLTAEEFTISDTLVDGLEFAGPGGNANTNPNQVVRSIAVKTLNNHKPGEEGTVSGPGEPDRDGHEINLKQGQHPVLPGGKTINVNTRLGISGKTLTVTVPAGDTLDLLKGKWIQVTFGARIEDKYRNIDALKALSAGVDGKDKSWEGTSTDKKGDPAYEYLVANGDKAIVAPILAEVGPDPVIWAVEAPSRLFARTAKGDYYATPMDDKSGNTWTRLDKDLDDGDDKGYGKPVWINADNRYYSRAPHASNTVKQLGMEDSKLNSLKGMPLVVGSEVTKAAEGATRYFAEVKDAEGGVHIWATDKGELDSLTWHEVKDKSSDEYIQAQGRLSNDRYTIRMLDLTSDTITLDPNSETGKNWPVISKEEHEGMANQGVYSVKFGNNADAKTYKTNTVTVKPETTELDVNKEWEGIQGEQWPVDSVVFSIYAVSRDNSMKPVYVDDDGKVVGVFANDSDAPDGSKQMTVTLNKGETSDTVRGLPRLKNTIYTARETKLVQGSKEYVVEYTNAKFDKTVNAKIISLNDREQIEPSVTASYRGEFGKKFESLRDQENNKKIVRGALADNRLWGMALDGSYFVTEVSDTEGSGEWTAIAKPSDSETDETKIALYDRAFALLGSIDANGRMTKGTVTGVGIIVEDIISDITATNTLGRFIDFEVTKKWTGVVANDIPSIKDFRPYLKLFDGENKDVTSKYADKLSITKRGTSYIAKWSGLPEGEYKAAEIEMLGFETAISEDGKTITNTKKPSEEKPEIEKYVNQAVHKDIELDEVFTYDIIAYVTKDADSVKITDKLHDMLTFEGDSSDVSVVDLGEADNHLVTNNVSGVKVNDKATVAKEGRIIDGTAVSINDQVLTVFITNTLKKSDAVYDPVQIDNIDPSAEGYYEKDGEDYKLTTDTSAEIDKQYFEESYKAAENIETGDDVSGGYYEKDGDGYKPTEDATAQGGKTYYERAFNEVTIEFINPSQKGYYEKDGETYKATTDAIAEPGKQYYVKSEEETGYEYDGDDQPVRALRGHWIKVTFKARINDKTLEEVKKAYQDISASHVDDSRDPDNVGNAPVISVEDHTGLPNDASYTIGVANEAGIQEDVHKDKSNVVTVKPKEKDKPDSGKKTDGGKSDDGEKDVQPDADQETKKPEQSKSGTTSANTGDEAPIGAALAGLLGAAGALVIMRRRRAKRID